MSELIKVENLNPINLFKENGMDDVFSKLEEEISKQVFDVRSPSGRKDIASFAHKIARTKTLFEKMGVDLVYDQKEIIKLVDAERKLAKEKFDALKQKARKPLTDWEDQEKSRVSVHNNNLLQFDEIKNSCPLGCSSVDIIEALTRLESIIVNESWEEFREQADGHKSYSHDVLSRQLEQVQAQEEQQREFEQLKKEKEERLEKERIEREEKEKADQAERDEKARLQKIEDDNQKEIARRENQKLLDIERDKRHKAELKLQEEKAEQDKINLEAKIKREADQRIEADKREREQKDRQKKQEEDLARQKEEKRQQNKRHQKKIIDQAATCFIENGFSQDNSIIIVNQIQKGLIKNITINF